MKVDVQLGGGPTKAAERSRELAALGVDGMFTFEGRNDVFLPLAIAAGAVQTDLMTNVAIAPPRSPLHLAHAAYDLQLLSGGRFRLGMGSQIKVHIEKRYGATWAKPAARMRETVLAIKAIFAAWEGEAPLRFEGEFSSHTLMPPAFAPGPNPFGPPQVCAGALGPFMTRAVAEVADGLLVMPFNSAEHFRARTLPAISEGLDRGERTMADLAIYPQVIVALGRTHDELEAARAGVRAQLAFYGSTPAYVPVLEVEGWEGVQPKLNLLSKQGDVEAMADLITDEMVAKLAVSGTPEECAVEIVDRFGGYAERVCCYFPGYEADDQLIADLVRALKSSAS